MSALDWFVLIGTIGFIVLYGVFKTQKQVSLNDYILGDQSSSWWKVGFAVMATQASAITFISTTGQGYSDGMRFVQFYFGLPLAMIVICISFLPRFYSLKVFTAYEYLENRFDYKTRTLAAVIFLIQRGLAAGITLYAPSIILSSALGWNLQLTHVISGIAVIIYTVSGGAEAVTKTQLLQMLVIFFGMLFAFIQLLTKLPETIHFSDALEIASWQGRLESVNFELNWNERYNFWAGITGGLFLALAYFGTDQSQVQRYLIGKNQDESKKGLIMNGILKIPMQVFILFCGVLLFVVFQFERTPIHFNTKILNELQKNHTSIYQSWVSKNDSIHQQIQINQNLPDKSLLKSRLESLNHARKELNAEVQSYVQKNIPGESSNDRDYVFLYYIFNYLPHGLIGLLIAVILSAAMSSISAEINALSGTSTVDLLKRSFPALFARKNELFWSRGFTVLWGVLAILFALYAQLFENLIQFINIIGSLFYGTVLGLFLTAFYIKTAKSGPAFYSALLAQSVNFILFFYSDVGYLWYNLIACLIVIAGSWVLSKFMTR